MNITDQQATALIARKITNGLSPEEEESLQGWIAASEDNNKLYDRLTDREYIQKQISKRQQLALTDSWNRISEEITLKRRRIPLRYIPWYAAVVGLLVFSLFWIRTNREYTLPLLSENIAPGTHKALLYLSNGDSVYLDGAVNRLIHGNDGSLINNDSTMLRYNQPNTGKAYTHRIVVPTGGEYHLELSDGTVVYLNSESMIEYPVEFSGSQREVMLEGEAYFRVSATPERPFIVKTGELEVVVTGTEFNVKAYKDEALVQTTLIRGAVMVRADGKEEEIKPGQQILFNRTQKALEVKDVDTDLYVAWVNGRFAFDAERLEDIMRVLSRWYDIEVIYGDESFKDLRFTGKTDRAEAIYPILDIIGMTHKVKITVKEKTIIFDAWD